VVQVLDHGIDQATGTPFIAMELLEGESLARRLKRVTRLSPPETFRIVSHLVRALSRAHAAGIVHRDLKPDNVFLVQNEEESLAKVLDFGVAKWTSTALPESGLTRPGAVLGTPFYMSPEQIQGSEVDHRADLWSLTAITCECLTGRRPFEANDFAQLAVMLLGNTGRPLPSSLGPVPAGFDAWFLRATASSISRRFQTARDMAQALAPICGVSSASWVPDSFPLTEELPAGSEPASMAGVSRTASRVFFKAGLWGRPWFKVVASALAAAVVMGGAITVWQRTASRAGSTSAASASPASPSPASPSPASPTSAPSRAVLSAKPAEAAPASPTPSVPPASVPAAPAVRIATDDGAADTAGGPTRPVLDQSTDNPGDLGDEPSSPEIKPRSGKPSKAKPKRAARRPGAPAVRAREPVSPTPPARNANAPSPESSGSALSVDGRRIRTSLTPNP
jgi:serine/threonine protein kinase